MRIDIKYLVPILAILLFVGTVSGAVSQIAVGNNTLNVDTTQNSIGANIKTTTWAKGYTLTTNSSIARNAIQEPDGSYLVGSDCYSGSCTTIMRIGSNGIIKWQKSYSMIGTTVMAQTSDNGSIIAGQKSVCNKSNSCGSILKVDSNGNIQWENDLLYSSQSPSTLPESIQQTSDGGYVVAGSAHGTSTNYSTWVVKLNSSGNIQWQRFFTNPGSNGAIAIKQTSDGYVVAGYSLTNSLYHILVIKLDLSGNLVWQRTYVTNYGSLATSLQLTSDGGYIVSGDVYTLNYFPALLLKLDSKGNIQWSKTYSDAGAGIQLNSIIQTVDGGYALSGYIYDGNDRAWLAKIDGNGSIQWQKTYGFPTSDRIFSSVNQTNDGGFVVSGATKQFSGKFDSWIVKTDPNGNIAICPDVQGSSVMGSTVPVTSGSGGLSIITNGNVYISDISASSSESYTPIKEC